MLLGVGGILAGDSTGYQWLEFPPYAAIVLFVAYSLVVSWAVLMFRFRRGDKIYITQWYLLGAFLWFPWVYGAAQIMLFVVPVQGVMQAAVTWWFANNLLFLWFGAIGLGTAYYMIPKVIGRPVYSYHLAAIGFWTYALFASWTGMQRLVDGPFPAWMITASIAATILTIIPVATVGLNHHMTMRGYFGLLRYSPDAALHRLRRDFLHRFQFGRRADLTALGRARYLHFTQASIAYSHLGLYAFFTMVMFGSMYYIVPRLVGREWRYASLIKLHFWSSAYGVGLMVLMLLVGGFVQGSSMNDPVARLQRKHAIDPAVSARPQRFRNPAHGRAFRFRVSFRPDAFWFGPHRERSDIFESSGRGGARSALMKGIVPLFLGIFGTFAFSWMGLTVIPNCQIGHLDPQMDEEGTDIYPAPKSGMAERGRHIYAANGCVYCHSQQVRADYAASDIDRKWGERRSAPRDYLFERPGFARQNENGSRSWRTSANVRPSKTKTAAADPPAANPRRPAASATPALRGQRRGSPQSSPAIAPPRRQLQSRRPTRLPARHAGSSVSESGQPNSIAPQWQPTARRPSLRRAVASSSSLQSAQRHARFEHAGVSFSL